jgi:iron complex outermembrane receptor protein
MRMLIKMPMAVACQNGNEPTIRKAKTLKVGALSVVFAALCTSLVLGTTFAAPPAEARSTTYNLDIPSQSLNDALQNLALASQHKLLYSSELVEGKKSPALKGQFTTEQAVKALLAGTKLTYEVTSDGLVLIRDASPSPTSNSSGASSLSHGVGDHRGGSELRLSQSDSSSVLSPQSSALSTRLAQANTVPTGPEVKQQQEQPKLEEIIVTAQKRSEDLQEVPVSVQVISGLQLEEQNQNSLSDLTRTVPDVHVSTGTVSNSLSIRGIGSGENQAGFDQAVAIFADDIYRGRSRMSEATFLDLDRIEILKGPQSTFFGNNAIAGALNIVSKKPGDTVDGYVRALGGMFEQYALEGAVGGPITDTLQARFAAGAIGNERGWLNDVNSGNQVPRIHDIVGRLTLVYKPTEALDATLKLEGGHHKTEGTWSDQPSQLINCPHPPLPASFNSSTCPTAIAQGVPEGFDQKDVSVLGDGNQLSNEEAILTLNYRLGNHILTSVTGYSYFDFSSDIGSGLRAPFVEVENLEHYHQLSQELRIASPTGQPIEYLAGAYFQTDQLFNEGIMTDPYLNLAFGPAFLPEIVPYLPFADRAGTQQGEQIYSVFGSVSWNVTDRLRLSAGLRGSQVDKDHNNLLFYGTSTQLYGGIVEDPLAVQQAIASAFGISQGTSSRLTQSNHALMPSARIQYQANPDLMAYFRYDRGFLAGGWNSQNVLDFNNISQFGPEHVNDYEAGFKSKWRDDTVLLNLNLFRADYSDLQVSTIQFIYNPITGTYGANSDLANAAKSRSQGVEFETQWLPMKNLSLRANVTYLHAYYVSYPNSSPNTVQAYCGIGGGAGTPYCLAQFPAGVPRDHGVQVNDLTGQATAYAPTWSGSMTAAYGVMLPGEFKLTTELDPYFTSNYYFVSGDPFFRTGGYVRWDARLAFAPQDGRWSLDLIGKNLSDRLIVTTQGFQSFTKEQPRNVALQFRYHFGRQ